MGEDLEYGSASTLSDWHRKGLQRFAEIVLDQERYLSRTQGRPSPLLEADTIAAPGQAPAQGKRRAARRASATASSF